MDNNSSPVQSNSTVYNIGDCIEFKRFNLDTSEYIMSKGKIVNMDNPELLEVSIYNYITNSFDGGIYWVDRGSIIKHYPKTFTSIISTRMILRDIWKNLIFREVKAVRTKEKFKIVKPYLKSHNGTNFLRYETYNSMEEAYHKTKVQEYNNIQVHHKDYYGFTTHKSLRSNDIYCNQEIFFSRKCYGELNLNNRIITGDFTLRRGHNTLPPSKGQYICGLVELGEKGLFYRKWFICSQEFLTLWTMVCEPDNYCLKNKTEQGYITKDLDQLLTELDTSKYLIPINQDIQIENVKFHNVESPVLYLPNIYQLIATSIFKRSKRNTELLYKSYEERFCSDLLWMK